MNPIPLLNGANLPPLGFGTWGMGGRETADHRNDPKNFAAIRHAVKQGLTHIDTAEYYGAGHCEELVAEAVSDFPRQNLFLSTKVWKTHLRYDDLLRSAERSLKRLKTDYLDLYSIHWPNPEVPLRESLRALDRLHQEKLIRASGTSNFSLAEMKEAASRANHPLVAHQHHYSLQMRDVQKNGILQHCQESGIVLTAYRPLEKGAVANRENVSRLSQELNRSPLQIALGWLLSQPFVTAIPMSTSTEHINELLGALEFELNVEQIHFLEN